jgi:hypothetical protein
MSSSIYATEFYFAILDDLPEIPEELVTNTAFKTVIEQTCDLIQFPGHPGYIRHDGKSHAPNVWTKNISDELLSWVSTNIKSIEDKNSICYRRVETRPDRNFYPPHVDKDRRFTLIYNIIDSGGKLVFWQEQDQPIFRERAPGSLKDYTQLTELCKFTSPYKKWYLINNQVIHSVENLQSLRENIQIECTLTDQLVIDYLKPLV